MNSNPESENYPGGFSVVPNEHRDPPVDLDAEKTVLSMCLVDGVKTIERALASGLSRQTFYDPRHGVMFDAIVALYRRKPPVESAMLYSELLTTGQLASAGGISYLNEVTATAPTTAQSEFFIEVVREKAALRWLLREAAEQIAAVGDYTGGGVAPLLRKRIDALVRGLQRVLTREQMPKSLAQICDDIIAEFKARRAGTVDKRGWIYVGDRIHDAKMLPWGCQKDDNYILIGSYSSYGKSAFARQVAAVALERGQTVRAYCGETSTDGFIESLAASKIGVDMKHPEQGPEDRAQAFVAEVTRMKEAWAEKTMWCVQQTPATPLSTIEDLADDARQFAKMQGPAHLWIVDYAQLFGTRKRMTNAREINDYISGVIQTLSRELGGVWCVLVQLNEADRKAQMEIRRDDNDKLIHTMPHRGNLRDSQKYYHDADRVYFIYRPPEDCRGVDQTSLGIGRPEQWLVLDKRRKGGDGFTRFWFEKIFTRFTSFSQSDHSDIHIQKVNAAVDAMVGAAKSDQKAKQ